MDLTHVIHAPSEEEAVFLALYAEIAMKDMLAAHQVMISSDGRDLLWSDEEAKKGFFAAIHEIQFGGCSE